MPGFPNFFMLYGPNTNIVVNGSIIWFTECEVRYVMDCHQEHPRGRPPGARRQGRRPRRATTRRSTPRTCAWRGASRRSARWYKSESGRVAQNWPFPLLEFWKRTREVDPADYELSLTAADADRASVRRLGIEFPIFAFSHCRDVVAAVSKAGGFGVLGAVAFSPDQLEIELDWIDEHVGDRPYGVDIIVPAKYIGDRAGRHDRASSSAS